MRAAELVSRLGSWSERREGRFVHLDCGEVPILKVAARHFDEQPGAPEFYRQYAVSLERGYREIAAINPHLECTMTQ